MNNKSILKSLKPVVSENSKILILGSMPGRESLEKQQYYAFKQNRFWKILFRYFNADFSIDYHDRINLITKNRIALWDTIKFCERENSSLDSKIKYDKPNDIKTFLKENNSITAVFLNGGKAEKVFNKHFNDIIINKEICPSTSPANAKVTYEQLYILWAEKLSKHLN